MAYSSSRLVFGLALASLALGAPDRSAPAPAQSTVGAEPMLTLNAGIHLIYAELAATEATRMRGLMFRPTLAPNHGMLFVFDGAARQCMWMRNTLLPLAVAYLDDTGVVVNIEEMQAQTDTSHCASKPVRYALEMAGGWFKAHGVSVGSSLRGLPPAPSP